MLLGTLIDTKALLDVAIFSAAAAIGVVTAFGIGSLAWDRIGSRPGLGVRELPWAAILIVTAVACIGIIGVGLWAMTQK